MQVIRGHTFQDIFQLVIHHHVYFTMTLIKLKRNLIRALVCENKKWCKLEKPLEWKIFYNANDIYVKVWVKGWDIPTLVSQTIEDQSDLRNFVVDYLAWKREYFASIKVN